MSFFTREEVLDEIESLRTKFGFECRVIERVGEFQFVITVRRPACQQTCLKLQLTDAYPTEAPSAIVRSTAGDSAEAESRLKLITQSAAGSAMLAKLAEAALPSSDSKQELQQQQQQHEHKQEHEHEHQHQHQRESCQRKKQRRAARRAAALAADTKAQASTKLKSMKTADDVIKRIQWDESIPQEDIVIGYLDRFKGVVEKQFDAFSWEDIASVDYYTFVIPRHRICYFRYKKAVVWDKSRRVDLVFGSCGAPEGSSIRDVIANYRDEDYPDVNFGDAEESWDSSDASASDDDSDSDDGVEVRIDRRLVGMATRDSDGEGEGANADADDELRGRYWAADLTRPNFFVCVRVTDERVSGVVRSLQSRLLAEEPLYEICCIPHQMLHCTLLTLRLDTAEQIADCMAALRAGEPELRQTLPQQPLTLHGVGCFHDRVLHAKVQHGDDFMPFVHHLRAVVHSAGYPVVDSHEFVPHVTIMKTTRPVSRMLGSRKIPSYMYAGCEELEFGQQAVDAVYLCSMEKERGPDGFYVTPGCVQFVQPVVTADRQEE